MKPEELRIGNWIDKNDEGNLEDFYQVTEHHFAENVLRGKYYGYPIELTQEWLERFGFDFWGNRDAKYCDTDYFWSLVIFPTGRIVCEHLDIEIKYVHQLQNIVFSLTGKELNYKN